MNRLSRLLVFSSAVNARGEGARAVASSAASVTRAAADVIGVVRVCVVCVSVLNVLCAVTKGNPSRHVYEMSLSFSAPSEKNES